jgi:NADH-quinone oxidoreductase subunit L
VDALQQALIVRPVLALARVVKATDRDVIDAYVRGVRPTLAGAGIVLRRAQTGLATAYAAWVFLGAAAIAIAGIVLV